MLKDSFFQDLAEKYDVAEMLTLLLSKVLELKGPAEQTQKYLQYFMVICKEPYEDAPTIGMFPRGSAQATYLEEVDLEVGQSTVKKFPGCTLTIIRVQ